MASLLIREYAFILKTDKANVGQMAKEPGLRDQTPVTYTSSTQSAAFGADTKYIAFRSDSLVHYEVGSNPTATASSMAVSAGETRWIAVDIGDKIAAYDGTT